MNFLKFKNNELKFPKHRAIYGIIWNVLSFCSFSELMRWLPLNKKTWKLKGDLIFYNRGPIYSEEESDEGEKFWTIAAMNFIKKVTHVELLHFKDGDLTPFFKFNDGKQKLQQFSLFGEIDTNIHPDIKKLIELRNPKKIILNIFNVLQHVELKCYKIEIRNAEWSWKAPKFLTKNIYRFIQKLQLHNIDFRHKDEEQESSQDMIDDDLNDRTSSVIPTVIVSFSNQDNPLTIQWELLLELYDKFHFRLLKFKNCSININQGGINQNDELMNCECIEFKNCLIRSIQWNWVNSGNKTIEFNHCYFQMQLNTITVNQEEQEEEQEDEGEDDQQQIKHYHGKLILKITNEQSWDKAKYWNMLFHLWWEKNIICVQDFTFNCEIHLTEKIINCFIKCFMHTSNICLFQSCCIGVFKDNNQLSSFISGMMFFDKFTIQHLKIKAKRVGNIKSSEWELNSLVKGNTKIDNACIFWLY